MAHQDEEGEKRMQKKVKFRPLKSRRGVRLTKPGMNLPTIGSFIFLAIYACIELTGGVMTPAGQLREIFYQYGVSREVLSQGRFWSLMTHSFLHGGWLHVILNAFLFYYATARLGHILSSKKIILLFLLSSSGAAFAQATSQWMFLELSQSPLVGASGGVMGLLLAQVTLYPDSRMLLLPVSGKNMGKGVLVASLLLFLMTPGLRLPVFSNLGNGMIRLYGQAIFQIGHFYHFVGGLLGMLIVGRLLPKLLSLDQLKAERAKRG